MIILLQTAPEEFVVSLNKSYNNIGRISMIEYGSMDNAMHIKLWMMNKGT